MDSNAQLLFPGESKYNCSSSASYMSICTTTYKPSILRQIDIVSRL